MQKKFAPESLLDCVHHRITTEDATMNLVTYEDMQSMGVTLIPSSIRAAVRNGRFPKPVKGGGLGGTKKAGAYARFYWDRRHVEAFVKSKRK